MICGGVCQVIIKRKENVPCSRDPGFGHNKVRDSGNVKGIRYLTATGKAAGISQNLGPDAGLRKRTIFGIMMTEVRDARFP